MASFVATKDLNGGQVVAPMGYPNKLYVCMLPPTQQGASTDDLTVELIEYGGESVISMHYAPSTIAGQYMWRLRGQIDTEGNFIPS
jgi:hypothetical protein